MQICMRDMPYVNQLSIYCEKEEVHLALSLSCQKATHLCFKSKVFSDAIFKIVSKGIKNIRLFELQKDDL